MSMDFKGSCECIVCGKQFNWNAYIYQGGGTECVSLNGVEADIIAKDKILTSEGTKIIFDAIVKCPKCRVKNKFEITK